MAKGELRLVWASLILLLCGRGAQGQSYTNCALTLSLKEVDCSDAAVTFTSVPQDAPPDTQRLIMTGNAISELYPGSFGRYPNLTVLYLDRNNLTSLQYGWLDELPSLEELYLDGNPLVSIDDGVFSNLTSLTRLSLMNTKLAMLRASMFNGTTALQTLSLDSNAELTALSSDVFTTLPSSLITLSLTNNPLQTIPDGIFDPLNITMMQVSLRGNPWSCDGNLEWLRQFLVSNTEFPSDRAQTTCQWPTGLINQPIADQVSPFTFYAPSVITSPSDADILTDRSFSLTCEVDGAPFPVVTWLKDGAPVQYSSRVRTTLYNASLVFTSTELSDAGVYQCRVTNNNGTALSSNATLTLTESTCFDGALSSHETDFDCGGELCQPCNITQRCRADSHCIGDLVCLYAHKLPSDLLYISPAHPQALTCRPATLPAELLNTRLQDALPMDILALNFTVDTNLSIVEDYLRNGLGEQFEISPALISGGSPEGRLITTVERTSPDSVPLVQLWPDFPRTTEGEQARQRMLQLLNNGQLKGTVRTSDITNQYKTRINI